MPDPLSITVGILAIAGACSAGLKVLKAACTQLPELARLEDELDHLKQVIRAVEELGADSELMNNDAIRTLLTKTTTHAQVQAQQLQSFLQSLLGPKTSVSKKIRRRMLITEKKRLQTFIEDIKTARAGIADSLALSTMYFIPLLPLGIFEISE